MSARRLPALLLIMMIAATPRLAGDEIQTTRFFRDSSPGNAFLVRAARGTGDGETVVFALQGPGGRRLLLRRGPAGPGAVLHEVWALSRAPGFR